MGRHSQPAALRRAVDRGWFHDRRAVLALACVAAFFGPALGPSAVSAHGGVAILRLGSERISPGGTIEVIGHMTTDDPVELALVAGDGAVRPIATVNTLDEGHFQVFVDLPADAPNGPYTVTARNGIELASAPVVLAGPPITDGEQGQRPGQDEPFAGGPLPARATPIGLIADGTEPAALQGNSGQPVEPVLIGVAVLAAVAVAFAFGTLARSRTRRRDKT